MYVERNGSYSIEPRLGYGELMYFIVIFIIK